MIYSIFPEKFSKEINTQEYHLIHNTKDIDVFYCSFEDKVIVSKPNSEISKILSSKSNQVIPNPFTSRDNKKLLSIFVTTSCNRNCVYCYAKGKDIPQSEIAMDFVKNFLEKTFDGGIEFEMVRFQGGGEPTQSINKIKEIVDLLEKKYKVNKFWIQSNLLFSKEVALWLSDKFSTIVASVDGPPDIQQKQRRLDDEDQKILEENILFLLSKDVDVPIKCTITKHSNNKQIEIVDYLNNLGIKTIIMEPVFQMGNAETPSNDYNSPPEPEDFLKEFVKTKQYARKLGILTASPFLPFEYPAKYHCGACGNIEATPCLTTDGFVSTCDEHFLGKGDDSVFIIGKYDDEGKNVKYDVEKMIQLKNRNTDNIIPCKSCFLKWRCKGMCPSRTFDETGDIFMPNKDSCELIQKYSKRYILEKLKENSNEILDI